MRRPCTQEVLSMNRSYFLFGHLTSNTPYSCACTLEVILIFCISQIHRKLAREVLEDSEKVDVEESHSERKMWKLSFSSARGAPSLSPNTTARKSLLRLHSKM